MSHVPHLLSEEFPADAALLGTLRAEDGHLARLSDDYHEVNRDIHRAETNVAPCSDHHMIAMRRRRLELKDEIAAILARARGRLS